MLTHDLNISTGRVHTASGVPGTSVPIIDGVIQAEVGAFLQVEAGQYLAFD